MKKQISIKKGYKMRIEFGKPISESCLETKPNGTGVHVTAGELLFDCKIEPA